MISVIYKYALDQMPREQVPELYRDFIGFEKRHGSVQGIEEVSQEKETQNIITRAARLLLFAVTLIRSAHLL